MSRRTEPNNPAAYDRQASVNRRRQVMILVGVMLGMLLAALDQTIVGTAIPRVIADLGELQHYAWVFTTYMLTSTVSVPIYGKLSDIYGRGLFFIGGMVLFLLGSVLSGLSQDMTQLILFRAIQGLGAGAILPVAQAIIGDVFLLSAASGRDSWWQSSVWPLLSGRLPADGSLIPGNGAGHSTSIFRSAPWRCSPRD